MQQRNKDNPDLIDTENWLYINMYKCIWGLEIYQSHPCATDRCVGLWFRDIWGFLHLGYWDIFGVHAITKHLHPPLPPSKKVRVLTWDVDVLFLRFECSSIPMFFDLKNQGHHNTLQLWSGFVNIYFPFVVYSFIRMSEADLLPVIKIKIILILFQISIFYM